MSQSKYVTKMARLSAKIFGEVSRPESMKDKKVLELFSKPYYHEKSEFVNYYPKHEEITRLMKMLRHYGLFRSAHLDFKDEMERLRQLRGKGIAARDMRKKNRRADRAGDFQENE